MLRGSVKPVTLLVHSLLLCVRLLGEAGRSRERLCKPVTHEVF